MNFKEVRVLVLDGYSKQMCAILEQLNQMGCVTTTLNYSKLDIGYNSKYPVKRILEPQAKNDTQYLFEVIKREIESGEYDAVFPILEGTTHIVTSNSAQFSKYVKIAAAPFEAFLKAYDKQLTMETCVQNGIPCPKTRADGESIDDFLLRASFPLALKPRKGTGSAGFKKIDDLSALNALIDSKQINTDEYIIQEFIGPHARRLACYAVVDEKQELKSAFSVNVIRQFPVDAGPGCFIETIERQDIADYSHKLLQAMGWTGFAHIGFIVDPRDGVPKVLEINGRIPASIKISALCGINSVRQIFECAFDRPVTPYLQPIKHVYLRLLHTDFLWLLKSKDRFKIKPSWFYNRNAKDYIFNIRDMRPFFSYSLQCLLRYKTDMKKKTH